MRTPLTAPHGEGVLHDPAMGRGAAKDDLASLTIGHWRSLAFALGVVAHRVARSRRLRFKIWSPTGLRSKQSPPRRMAADRTIHAPWTNGL